MLLTTNNRTTRVNTDSRFILNLRSYGSFGGGYLPPGARQYRLQALIVQGGVQSSNTGSHVALAIKLESFEFSVTNEHLLPRHPLRRPPSGARVQCRGISSRPLVPLSHTRGTAVAQLATGLNSYGGYPLDRRPINLRRELLRRYFD